jgi:P-type Cu2+ transporter
VTFGLAGETFYDAAAVLATFVLLGHWFEMRARGGANDAIRVLVKTLLGVRRLPTCVRKPIYY